MAVFERKTDEQPKLDVSDGQLTRLKNKWSLQEFDLTNITEPLICRKTNICKHLHCGFIEALYRPLKSWCGPCLDLANTAFCQPLIRDPMVKYITEPSRLQGLCENILPHIANKQYLAKTHYHWQFTMGKHRYEYQSNAYLMTLKGKN